MELNKKIIKALASDTKTSVLKSLLERNKTSAELSRELSLSPSTMAQHMKELEIIGLVERIDTDNKWVYYKLSNTGKNVIKPKFPVKMTILLSTGFVVLVVSFLGMMSNFIFSGATKTSSDQNTAVIESVRSFQSVSDFNILFAVLFIIGLVIVIYCIWKLTKLLF